MGLKERIPERITLRLILRQEHTDDRPTLGFRVLSSEIAWRVEKGNVHIVFLDLY